MSILALVHLLAFLGDIVLIIIVISRDPKARLNWFCAMLAASFAMWSLGYCLTHNATTPDSALFWINISSIGWITFPIAGLYFYLALAGKEKAIRNKILMLVSVLVIAFFLYQQWTGNLVGAVIEKSYGWAGIWSMSVYSYLLYTYFIATVAFNFYLIYDYGRKVKTNREKIQAKLLQATAVVGLSLGVVTDIILPVLHVALLPQVGDICIFLWVIGIVVCLTRYGLMSVSPITAADKILDTITDALILLEPDGKVALSNRATLELLECNEKTLNGTNFNTLTNMKKSADDFLKKAMNIGKNLNRELVLNTKTGRQIPVLASASVIQDRTKTTVGFVVLAKDITERKNIEKAIKDSEENIRLQKELIERVLATIPNAVFLLDGDLQVLMTNQAAYNILKLKNEETENTLIGKTLEILELNQAIVNMRSRGEKNTHIEFRRLIAQRPRILKAEIFTMPINELLVVINDYTEEQEKQERLLLTDRLASVGEMASGVAHELNNPLTSIIGLSSLLVEQPMSGQVDDMKEDLNAINSEAKRCAAVVKNLLTFARQHAPKREIVSIVKIMDDVIKLRAYEHKAKDIFVEVGFPADLPEVLADYFQMQQVFLNIVLNSETAMIDAHGHGTLKITGELVNNYIKIAFSDDGPGISEENIRLIFNPFFTTKDVGKGTGLGLSICYGIITAHEGKIYAKSEYGQGATFVVELPVIGHSTN